MQTATKVVVDGNYAYVSQWTQNAGGTIIDYTGEFQVFDITNPAAPAAISHITLPDAGRGIFKSGNLVFIATAWRGVTIIDVTDPASPTQIKVLDTPNIALDVWVEGTTLWVADASTGVIAYNISTPTSPVTLSTFDTVYQANGLWKSGNYLYVCDLQRFYILDVSNPASPVQKGTVNYNGSGDDWFRHVTADGTYAYIACFANGFKVVDVSNPLSPAVVGSYNTPGQAWHVHASGNYLFVADLTSGVEIYDVSTPSAPVLKATYDTPGSAYGLDVIAPYVYVADMTSGFRILEFTDEPNVQVTPASVDFGTVYLDAPTSGRTVSIRNTGSSDLNFVGPGVELEGSSEFFISNDPVTTGSLAAGTSLPVVVSFDPEEWVGSRTATLKVYTDDPDTTTVEVALSGTGTETPPLYGLGGASTLQTATKVVVDGDYAYVSEWTQNESGQIIDYTGEFQIFDISNPATPVAVSHLTLPDAGRGIFKSGNLVYIGTAWMGVTIIDVTNPAAPTQVHVLNTPSIALDVWVEGTTLWVADAYTGVVAYDVSTPTAPVELSRFDTPYQAAGVWKSGDYLYVADLQRFYILDVTNPASPVQKGTLDYNGNASDWFRHVTVEGNYAYLACTESGIRVVDVSNPLAPAVVGTCDTDGTAYHVHKSANYLYVADYAGGVDMINVANPASPFQVATYDTTGNAYGLDVVEPYIYVADMTGGFLVLTHIAAPHVAVSPLSVDLGAVRASDGPTSGRTVTITNVGVADLSFVGAGVEIEGSSEFIIDNDPVTTGTLAPDASIPVVVKFDPEGLPGGRAATLKICTNDPDTSVVQVALSGTVLEPPPMLPNVEVTPLSVDLGSVMVDDGPTSGRTVLIRNTGDADLSFVGAGVEIAGGSEFFIANSPNTSAPLGVGETLPVVVNFDPDGAAGIRSATLNIYTNDPDTTTVQVSLTGTALEPLPIWALGSAATLQTAIKVIVDGSYAYVSQWKQDSGGTIVDGTGELQIFDVSNPAAPVSVGHLTISDAGRGICKSGSLVYIATAWKGFTIVDVSNPAAPALVKVQDTSGIALDVWVEGTTLWVADAMGGVKAYNVGTPTAPVLLSTYYTANQANGLCKTGNLMCVTDLNRFYVLDVTNPASPVLKDTIDYNGSYTDWFRHVTVDGHYAYTANNATGIKVIDISNPANISVVATYDTAGAAWHVAKKGDYLYVADGANGVDVIDVSTPSSPVHAATHDTPGSAMGLDVSEPCIYVADMTAGLRILCTIYPVTVLYVNFPYLGVEYGSIQYPFNTLEEGVAKVIAGGTVRVTGQTSAPIRITKPMRLESYGGSARIGGIN
ncbi:MAG: choice-of-anchor D domain-containing protein [Candidatus Sumerlaeia bacterium]